MEDAATREARLRGALAGEAEALAELAGEWADPFYRFALRMLGRPEDAQDVAQEALVKLLRGLAQFDPTRPFAAWAFQIVRNACLDHLRRQRRALWEPADEPAMADPSPGPLDQIDAAERATQVERALAGLAPMYREVLVLYHFEHLKYTEIAEVLELPLGTVMNRIFRARQRARALLEAEGFGP